MMRKMMRRMMHKWMAALLVAILAIGGVGYWGFQQSRARERVEVTLTNNYNRAFLNTVDHLQNLEVLLAKGLVAADQRQDDKIFTEVWQQATAILDNLTQLPISDVVVGRTAKFITQLGDFSRGLAENSVEGRTLSSGQYEKLQSLYRQAGDLNNELQKIEAEISAGKTSLVQLADKTRAGFSEEGKKLASANFQTMDKQMHSYPTLIYDGPFSDNLAQREAKGVGKNKINAKTAESKALDFMDLGFTDKAESDEGNKKYTALATGKIEGKIPAYRVELMPKEGSQARSRRAVMDISCQGGQVVWSIVPRDLGQENWSIDRARDKAKKFLEKQGHRKAMVSYYQKNDGLVTFNFVPRENGIIVYPDMIKVSVALDNGEIIGTDARGYLMNHHQRHFDKPKLSEQEALGLIGRGVKIEKDGRLAIIPTESFQESLAWEFRGQLEGNTFLIYINALTGEEERILQLFEDKNGSLTM